MINFPPFFRNRDIVSLGGIQSMHLDQISLGIVITQEDSVNNSFLKSGLVKSQADSLVFQTENYILLSILFFQAGVFIFPILM